MAVSVIKKSVLKIGQVKDQSVTIPANTSVWISVSSPFANTIAVTGYHLNDPFFTMRSITFNKSRNEATLSIRNWYSSPITDTISVEFLYQE